MDYKSIRTILDSPRDKLEDLALRVACEFPKEFRHCAILNGMINDIEALVTWDGERVELTSKQMSDVRTYAEAGQKLEAIKALREATRIGLKDAMETIKQLYPQFGKATDKAEQARRDAAQRAIDNFVPAFAPVRQPVQDERTFSPLFYPDRRPGDPGYVGPESIEVDLWDRADDFVEFTPPRVPEGFNDDQPRGVTLGELLRQQIDENAMREKIDEAFVEIDKAFNR